MTFTEYSNDTIKQKKLRRSDLNLDHNQLPLTSKLCWYFSDIINLLHKIITTICILEQIFVTPRDFKHKIHPLNDEITFTHNSTQMIRYIEVFVLILSLQPTVTDKISNQNAGLYGFVFFFFCYAIVTRFDYVRSHKH